MRSRASRMQTMLRTIAALVAVAVALATRTAANTEKLEEFAAVRACLPFNLMLSPSEKKGEYAINVDAEQDVRDAVKTNVTEAGLLEVSLKQAFTSTKAVRVTITMPGNKLKEVASTGIGALVLSPGFSGKNITLANGLNGDIVAVDVDYGKVTVVSESNGAIFVSGKMKNVTVEGAGGEVFLAGPTGKVDVDLTNRAKVYIIAGSDDLEIIGEVGLSSSVTYDNGSCAIDADYSLSSSSSCLSVDTSDLEEMKEDTLASLLWTCGMTGSGAGLCDIPEGLKEETATEGMSEAAAAASSSSSSSSSSSNGGQSTSFTRVSGDNAKAIAGADGTDSQSSTTGLGSQASAVLNCLDDSDLLMLTL